MQKTQPKESAEFWCDNCDYKVVHSEKPETGNFYVQFGHSYNEKTKLYDGDYVGVMFALCCDCVNSENSK